MKFISITKPGIIFGNAVTVCGAFFLGSHLIGQTNYITFLATLVGMSLVIAAGCVFNNYIDRDIDQLMERTKNRILAKGLLSHKVAISYALLLAIIGYVTLSIFTNLLSTLIALFGLVIYVIVYSMIYKRRSIYGTAIGGIAGAIPPVVGYVAATNQLDIIALILFTVLFFWQIPHSYAIAIYRLNDYRAASIPVLPVKKNILITKHSMMLYIAAFTAVTAALAPLLSLNAVFYFIVTMTIGCYWFYQAWQGLKVEDDKKWARKMFLLSVINISIISTLIGVL